MIDYELLDNISKNISEWFWHEMKHIQEIQMNPEASQSFICRAAVFRR